MKIVIITGNRPQFIKSAALYRAIDAWNKEQPNHFQLKLVHTGQHYDKNMSDVFFSEMELPSPDYYLGVGGCPQGAMTGRMLEKIEVLLQEENPDWILVFGDTNSTLAGALAAVKMHIPIAHVEAGLRSFNRKMPEEINRILTDQCADLLFTPTESASLQLLSEGISRNRIRQVGDVMLDVFLHYQQKAKKKSVILEEHDLPPKKYVLVTVHRAENTDDPNRLREIIHGLVDISQYTRVIFPLHPRTKHTLSQHQLFDLANKEFTLVDPVGYFDMLQLETNAEVIFTDSGGVQKEAYFSQVPCVTMRDETEWSELIDHGYNRLVSPQKDRIVKAYKEAKEKQSDWVKKLYGAGAASRQILESL